MKTMIKNSVRLLTVSVLACLAIAVAQANAVIPGIQGPNFTLNVGPTTVNTPDAGTLYLWLYGDASGATTPVQYPGPTLIVNEGDAVTVTLNNTGLMMNTSIIFPGQGEVTTTNGVVGDITQEAAPGGTVTYSFTATNPGTYLYQSGTHMDLQVEMGLVGALIVRPSGFDQNTNRVAYGSTDSAYDHEYLFVLSEMDPVIHERIFFGEQFLQDPLAFMSGAAYNISDRFAVYWFINGRNGLDALLPPNVFTHPNQPYNSLPQTRPGEKVLMRFVGAGHDAHPFHAHGNHNLTIARDGRLLSSNAGASADLATSNFTNEIFPGQTSDAIFDWTSKGLGWDIYGDPTDPAFAHTCNGASVPTAGVIDSASGEDCTYHGMIHGETGTALPVDLPVLQDLAFGGWYSGSPFLGTFGNLPPGEGGNNINGGLFFMWHSHDEKELTDFDIFPGGMLTFMIIEPPGTPIP